MSQPSFQYCPNGHANRVGAKFCSTCRTPLMPTSSLLCPNCNRVNRAGANFCAYCHARLAPPSTTPFVFSTTLPVNSFLHQRYTIARWVGGGGMGAVYEAWDNRIQGRRVAVKEVNAATIPNPQEVSSVLAMFQQEAQLLAQLHHPNLPGVSDFFIEGNKQYLVMDFVEGRTLEKALEENRAPFSEAQVVSIGMQLCDVLDYLHTRPTPIIFRDLKPANVMLDATNRIKLIDFGIARSYKPGRASDTHQFGSPGYAPPEQYGQGQTDARSDIYALNVTLYHLLTRYDPALNPFNLPPLISLNPSLSPKLIEIINTGMLTDPSKRWQSVREMRNALNQFRPTGGTVKPGGSSRITTRLILKAAELSPTRLGAAIGAILIGIILAAWLFTPTLSRIPWIWDNADFIALVAPLAYAATRKRFVAGIAHTTVATFGGIAVWSSLGYTPPVPTLLAVGLTAGAFAELWLALLPKIRGTGADPWQREVGWLAVMAVIVATVGRVVLVSPAFGLSPTMWIFSALIGALGWFLGDLVQQYLFLRQRGFRRVGYF